LGKCLYISGVPGTGKTATVMEILRQARRRVEDGELPRFQLVEINGNRLPSPYHAYTHLYEVSIWPGAAGAAELGLRAWKLPQVMITSAQCDSLYQVHV